MENKLRTASVQSLTYSDLHSLEIGDLAELFAIYEDDRLVIEANAFFFLQHVEEQDEEVLQKTRIEEADQVEK